MHLLLTGVTGFIGQSLVPCLLDHGHICTIWPRKVRKAEKLFGKQVRIISDLSQLSNDAMIDGIVNLAGAGIGDCRWNRKRRQLLRHSRIHTTQALIDLIARLQQKPEVLINGSAIGYYGFGCGDTPLEEDAEVNDDFSHQLCADWEYTAMQAGQYGVRVCLVRTGIVLQQGGALQKMLLPFRLGLGGPIGNGHQWMSWIHMVDQVQIIAMLLIHKKFSGAYNLVAPTAVTNQQFTCSLARLLNRPALIRIPAWLLRLLLGRRADLVLEGQPIIPRRLLDASYTFDYPELEPALKQVLQQQ
jgi:uncharacterized protein (TIGR01777 family)